MKKQKSVRTTSKRQMQKAAATSEKARKAVIAEIEGRLSGSPSPAGTSSPGVKTAKPKTDNAGSKPSAKSAQNPARPPRSAGAMSGLDAAAKVLTDAGKPMRCGEMVKAMIAKGLWSTSGKTPNATIYAAIIREIKDKAGAARFIKKERGLFALNGKAARPATAKRSKS